MRLSLLDITTKQQIGPDKNPHKPFNSLTEECLNEKNQAIIGTGNTPGQARQGLLKREGQFRIQNKTRND